MYTPKTGSDYHLGFKVIFVSLFRAIFFPLFALWMLWKINMSSKKEILEDLARFRAKSDVVYRDLYEVSTSALKIMSVIESNPQFIKDEHRGEYETLIKDIQEFGEKVLNAIANSNEYASSLLKDYSQAIKKIGNASGD
ncbi:hypothetical protein [Moellerella wisconsensis]|uniref:Uncharacterized protein n=1 Tax=Moellerella wisconsensis TaxID=158849 RepID=A0ACD3YB27_9GAMM|nr:hypothetical protein [Moellerella wisconsensis]UNH40190.1 hypothetical protein MNY70_07100 [Moellerella wisconsensis]